MYQEAKQMNRYKATIILFAAAAGFLIIYPLQLIHRTFWWGLLGSGFSAAMIGGVADWFGVTALFRKPLGVPFRTEIIPRNREKIFNALSNMVGSELLSKENLRGMVSKFNTSELLIKYIKKENKKEDARKALIEISHEVLWNINSKEVGNFALTIIKENVEKLDLATLTAAAVELSIKNGYDEKIIDFMIDEAKKLSRHSEVKSLITLVVQETMRSYEKDSTKRKFVNSIMFDMMLQKSPQDIAGIVQRRLEEYLEKLKDPQHESRIDLKEWINKKIDALRNDCRLREQVERFKMEQFNNRFEINSTITTLIEKIRSSQIEEFEEFKNILNMIDSQIENFIEDLEQKESLQQEIDVQIKKILMQLIEKSHGEISIMVRENLNRFSEDMLVELIESRTGNDLQIIRINGSVVGGLVGMLVFVFHYCIGL